MLLRSTFLWCLLCCIGNSTFCVYGWNLKCDHSNESCSAVLSFGAAYFSIFYRLLAMKGQQSVALSVNNNQSKRKLHTLSWAQAINWCGQKWLKYISRALAACLVITLWKPPRELKRSSVQARAFHYTNAAVKQQSNIRGFNTCSCPRWWTNSAPCVWWKGDKGVRPTKSTKPETI